MGGRGREIKGKKTKVEPKCKIYIFCEGETEKIYLKHFENRTYNVEIIPVDTVHTDARGIVMFAKNFINSEKLDLKLGDRGYCVFDSDPASNPDINTTFNILRGCETKGLRSIFSNPSFEVWFALHFGSAPHGKNAMQMKQYVKKLLEKNSPDYSETTDIYESILPQQESAIARAKQLHKSQAEVFDSVCSHECNPYTDIFEFIEHMNEIKEKSKLRIK